jgi:hypothetical protein
VQPLQLERIARGDSSAGRNDNQPPLEDDFGVGFVPEANMVGKAISATRRNPSGGLESVAIQ